MPKGKEVTLPSFLTLVQKDYKATGWGTQRLSEQEMRKRIATVQSDLASPEDKKSAQDEVVKSVFGLMVHMVSSTSFRRGEEPVETMGRLWEMTLRSIKSYDLKRRDSGEANPALFSTYVAEAYKKELALDRRGIHIMDIDMPVNFSPTLKALIAQIKRVQAKLFETNGDVPVAKEVFTELYGSGKYVTNGENTFTYGKYNATPELISNIMRFMSPPTHELQDSKVDTGEVIAELEGDDEQFRQDQLGGFQDNEHTPHEDLLDPEELAAHDEDTEAVWKFLDTISERDRQLLIQGYGLGMSVNSDNTILPRVSRTARQLAIDYGISNERASQIVGFYTRGNGKRAKTRAYKRLKEMVYGKDEPAS